MQLRFTNMAIEQHSRCGLDYLEIFNGGLSSSPSIGKFCGTSLPPNITSQSNELRIEFHSDSADSASGFRLEYQFDSRGTV